MKGAVLVTGASGFIGRDLVCRLAAGGWQVRAAARDLSSVPRGAGIERASLPDLLRPVDWQPLVAGMTHVVHLAGIAHATSTIPDATYMAVNAEAVGTLAAASKSAGVRRVVMMSSIRAQCGASAEGILTEADPPRPDDAYGRAKLAGEQRLAEALASGPVDWCVLRPVVVYGPGVKGNVAALVRLARLPLPLPIGALAASRSLLGLANLASGVEHALTSPAACRRVFVLADPGPLTLPGIVAAMREGLGRKRGIVPVPLAPLRLAARLAGRGAAWHRIAGDLVVSTASLEASGWTPIETAHDGILRWMREPG
jgi:nucleoside-diphosphate-sugar epimerase